MVLAGAAGAGAGLDWVVDGAGVLPPLVPPGAAERRRLFITLSRRCGDEDSKNLDTAAFCSAALTSEGAAPGRSCIYRAAAPATCSQTGKQQHMQQRSEGVEHAGSNSNAL